MLGIKICKALILLALVSVGMHYQLDAMQKVTVPITITHVAGCEVTGRWCYAEFTTHYITRPETVEYYKLSARDHAQLVEGRTGMYYKTKYEASSDLVRALIIVTWLIIFCLGVWWLYVVHDILALLINAYKVRRNEAYLTVQRGKHRRSSNGQPNTDTDWTGCINSDATSISKLRQNNSSSDSFLGGMFFGSSSSDSGSSGSSDSGGGGSD